MSLISRLRSFKKTDPYLFFVIVAASVYALVLSVICILRYEAFSYSDYDAAIYIHELWKVLHGSANVSILNNVPIWGNAQEFASVYTSPFYALSFFNPRSVFVLQSVFLGAGAIPVYLIACRKLPKTVAVAFALSYLCYPAMGFSNLYEYNPLSLTTFTLLMAFYFFQGNRFGWFMVFILLSMFNRLDVGMVTAMFGVYAFVVRKPWRWVIVPFVVSLGWVCFGLFYLIPNFKGIMGFDMYYPQFGKGFGNIIVNVITHPVILWNSLMTTENAKLLMYLFIPVGFLSLGGPLEFLICGLSLAQHMISLRSFEHTIYYHYTSTITPFVYIAAIYGAARYIKFFGFRIWLVVLPIALSIAGNVVYGPLSHYREYAKDMTKDELDDYKSALLRKIDPAVSVASSFEFSPMLAGRYDYYSFHYIYSGLFHTGAVYPVPENIGVVLVNFNDFRLLSFSREESASNMTRFFAMHKYGVVSMANSVVFLQDGYKGRLQLYEVKKSEENFSGGLLKVKDWLLLKGFTISPAKEGDVDFLEFIFDWRSLSQGQDNVWMNIRILRQGEPVYEDAHQICYGIYPAKKWALGEDVADHYRMLIPKRLKSGEYDVDISFMTLQNKRMSPAPAQWVNFSGTESLGINWAKIAQFNLPFKKQDYKYIE
jgi:uncharacterized membrane protein